MLWEVLSVGVIVSMRSTPRLNACKLSYLSCIANFEEAGASIED